MIDLQSQNKIQQVLRKSFKYGFFSGIKGSLWLFKIVIPASFIILILKWSGLLEQIAYVFSPAFQIIGLPGEAALAYLSSLFVSFYAGIAVIETLDMAARDITILAILCLTSHNIITEGLVVKKVGLSLMLSFVTRVLSAFILAFVLNLLLPNSETVEPSIVYSPWQTPDPAMFPPMFIAWVQEVLGLCLTILVIITFIMIVQNILKESGVLKKITWFFEPAMRILLLPGSVSFLWIVSTFLGLAYGATLIFEEVENKHVSKKDAKVLCLYSGIFHSAIEDPLLFVALGAPYLWITFPRVLMATIAVLIYQGCLRVFSGFQNSKS